MRANRSNSNPGRVLEPERLASMDRPGSYACGFPRDSSPPRTGRSSFAVEHHLACRVEAVRKRVRSSGLSGRRSHNNGERQRGNNPHVTCDALRNRAVKHDHRHWITRDHLRHVSTDRKRIQPLSQGHRAAPRKFSLGGKTHTGAMTRPMHGRICPRLSASSSSVRRQRRRFDWWSEMIPAATFAPHGTPHFSPAGRT
jgi:hypothetical protein